MITARNIHKSFGGKKVLDGLSMNVKEGEIYGFIGQNGAGKTTTLDIIAGLSSPDSGHCRVNGKDTSLVKFPGDLNIGYLPEEPKFYSWMTAFEILEYLMDEKDSKRVKELLHLVGLEKSVNRRAGEFSRGMRQRLGIASALARNPSLLILDEPSSALDPEGRVQVLDLILNLKGMGKTIIFSTHILGDVERICDTVGIISDGVLAVEKPLGELKGIGDSWVFEVAVENKVNNEVIGQMKMLECVTGVEAHENLVRIYSNGNPLASVDLMKVLVENHVGVVSFVKGRPSLEEIFIQEVTMK